MKHTIKGLCDINLMKLGQQRRMGLRVQYEYEVLNELSQLSREKTWLNKEKENWQERINRINKRLSDIDDLEKTLIQKQKQMATKEQLSNDAKKDDQPSVKEVLKESHEIIIKY